MHAMLIPPENRGMNTYLIVERGDSRKAKEVFNRAGINVRENEVLLIKLKNTPGTMSEACKRVSDNKINMTYAFCVAISKTTSYFLLGTEDNEKALKALG